MRLRILEAAKQEFSAHGLAGARVDRIAAKAGANKRMLYYHVGNKDDLYLAVLEGAYDREMPIMSKDGIFDTEALKIIKQSWVDMKTLPSVPSDDQILTRRFVPVKVQTAGSH